MTDYTKKALATDAKLRAKGQLITLTLKQPGVYAGGKVTAAPPVITSAWGIEEGVTAHDLGVGTVNGTLIKSGDRKLMLSAFANDGTPLPAPKVKDLALAGGQLYTIENVDGFKPAGIIVFWSLVARI